MIYKPTKMNVGYSRESTMIVTRTTHKISFHSNQSAMDLLECLSRVPKSARIIEWSEGDSEANEWPWIRFECETDKAQEDGE